MKNAKGILSILIILVFLCFITSCKESGGYKLIEDLIRYISENSEGNSTYLKSLHYDDYEQKSMRIYFTEVDTLTEADEIVRLINQYLEDHPDFLLNDDYYLEVYMDSEERNKTQNFSCSNSMEFYRIGDEEGEEYYDVTVPVEVGLCYLRVIGYTLRGENLYISHYSGLFSDIRVLVLHEAINLDDLSAFGTLESLERVVFLNREGHIQENVMKELDNLYTEIVFESVE